VSKNNFLTRVGFDPTLSRTRALICRLRPLGHLFICIFSVLWFYMLYYPRDLLHPASSSFRRPLLASSPDNYAAPSAFYEAQTCKFFFWSQVCFHGYTPGERYSLLFALDTFTPSSAKPCVAVFHSLWLKLHSNVGKFVGVMIHYV
jgi:hypothetical protein